MRKIVMTKCYICGEKVKCQRGNPWRSSLDKARERKACCSEKCTKIALKNARKKSAEFLKRYNKKYASERMKKHNPMFKRKNVERAKAVKRANGTLNIWKGKRGGNGQYTPSQILLATALGWEMEIAIKTGNNQTDGSGYPTCYKVDIGNRKLKIAIEVDGKMHRERKHKVLDQKKENKLIGLGWKVLRFTNKEVIEHLEVCVKTVMSII